MLIDDCNQFCSAVIVSLSLSLSLSLSPLHDMLNNYLLRLEIEIPSTTVCSSHPVHSGTALSSLVIANPVTLTSKEGIKRLKVVLPPV